MIQAGKADQSHCPCNYQGGLVKFMASIHLCNVKPGILP